MSADESRDKNQQITLSSEMGEEDWQDVSESEFVDFVEGVAQVGFVFRHPEIGLHGFRFHLDTGDLEPCAFSRSDEE